MVTRVSRQNSSEVRDSPEAQASIRAEMIQMVNERKAFDPKKVRSWLDVRREDPNARKVDAILLTAIKN